jgi:hypothetical protein
MRSTHGATLYPGDIGDMTIVYLEIMAGRCHEMVGCRLRNFMALSRGVNSLAID